MAYIEIRTPQKFTNPAGLIEIPDLYSDLLVDLDADVLTGGDGSAVTSWAASGSVAPTLDAQVATTSPPTLEVGTAGGSNAVRFEGSNSIATPGALGSHSPIVAHGAPMTALLVFRNDSESTLSGRILSGFNTAPNYRNIQFIPEKITAAGSVEGQGDKKVALNETATVGEWMVYAVRWSEGKIKIISSSGDSAEVEAQYGPINGLLLGSSYGGFERLIGALARLQLFGRGLTDGEMTAAVFAMAQKYIP